MRAVILLLAVLPAWIAFHVVSGPASTTTTSFTSRPELYVVPAGVCRIRIEAVGAADGGEGAAGALGSGVHAVAGIRVAPTEMLRVRVCGLPDAAAGTSAVDAVRHGGAAADGAAVAATPSPAAVTAFYRRAEERTAKLMGRPAPKWRVCPSCKLAFHGPDTLAENPATGHTPGDWQP